MRAQVQRVRQADVEVESVVVGRIDAGLLAYVGAATDDSDADVAYIADKLVNLRIFPDEAGRMNRSVLDEGGSILIVSAFSLLADAANARIEQLISQVRATGLRVETGRFRAHMLVRSINDGPLCIPLDSRRLF